MLSTRVPDHTCHRSKEGGIQQQHTKWPEKTHCGQSWGHFVTVIPKTIALNCSGSSHPVLFTVTSAVPLSFSIPIISYSFGTLAPLPRLALICCSTSALQAGSLHAIVLSKHEPEYAHTLTHHFFGFVLLTLCFISDSVIHSFKIWGLKAVYTYKLNYNKTSLYLSDMLLLLGKEKYTPSVSFVIRLFYN